MEEGRDNIKNIFSTRLKDFEAEVPANLWAGIENDLPAPKIFLTKRTLAKIGAGAASIAVAVAMTIFVVDSGLFSNKPEKSPVIEKVLPKKEEMPVVEETVVPEVARTRTYRRKKVHEVTIVPEEVRTVEKLEENVAVKTVRKSFYTKKVDQLSINNVIYDAEPEKQGESFYKKSETPSKEKEKKHFYKK